MSRTRELARATVLALVLCLVASCAWAQPGAPSNLRVSGSAVVAWTRLGTDTWTSGVNSSSSSRTIPAGTEITIVYVTGYVNSTPATYFTSGTLTLNGVGMTGITGSDASNSFFKGAAFHLVNPSTGAQTLAWDWEGVGDPGNGVLFVAVHYSGLNTADPIRGTYADQEAAPPYETTTLTAVSGDMVSIAVFGFIGSEGSVTTWSNATEISEFTGFQGGDITLAEHEPSGNVIIATTASVGYEDGGIIAIVLKPATAGAATTYPQLERIARGIERGILMGTDR